MFDVQKLQYDSTNFVCACNTSNFRVFFQHFNLIEKRLSFRNPDCIRKNHYVIFIHHHNLYEKTKL